MKEIYFYTSDADGVIEVSDIFISELDARTRMIEEITAMLDKANALPEKPYDDDDLIEAMHEYGDIYYKLHTGRVPFSLVEIKANELNGLHDMINELLQLPGVTEPADNAEKKIREKYDEEAGYYTDVLILAAYRDMMCWLLHHEGHNEKQFLENVAEMSKVYREIYGVDTSKLN